MKTMAFLCVCLLSVPVVPWAEETIEWIYPLDAPGSAPTLFPDAESPTGVVVAAGAKVIRLDGKGQTVWAVEQSGTIGTPATVADLDGDGNHEVS
ncbi:MAG: PQQ-like beta-propeller repeat protein, partial [Candidatus Hydrogenedentes bacterium]|nr:PQQ-like beta-propeller repeat protein [Candidatus Hydrogenedentota bacterium]